MSAASVAVMTLGCGGRAFDSGADGPVSPGAIDATDWTEATAVGGMLDAPSGGTTTVMSLTPK